MTKKVLQECKFGANGLFIGTLSFLANVGLYGSRDLHQVSLTVNSLPLQALATVPWYSAKEPLMTMKMVHYEFSDMLSHCEDLPPF